MERFFLWVDDGWKMRWNVDANSGYVRIYFHNITMNKIFWSSKWHSLAYKIFYNESNGNCSTVANDDGNVHESVNAMQFMNDRIYVRILHEPSDNVDNVDRIICFWLQFQLILLGCLYDLASFSIVIPPKKLSYSMQYHCESNDAFNNW